MKSRSRQGRIENGNHKRKIRRSTDLAKYPGFGWEPHVFTYTCQGFKIRLRFCQETGNWNCKCPQLNAQIDIPHQAPENIENILENWVADVKANLWLRCGVPDWLTDNLPQTTGPRVPSVGQEVGVWLNV